MVKLYELPFAYEQWERKVEENDGEINEFLMEELAELEGTLGEKVDACCAVLKKFEYEEYAYREEARRLTERARVSANKQTRLKNYVMAVMEQMKTDHIKGKRFSVRYSQTTKPTINWISSEPIPENFRKSVETLDKQAALASYEGEGFLPEGFEVRFTRFVVIR